MKLVLLIATLQGPQSVYHISAPVDIVVTLGAGLGSALERLRDIREYALTVTHRLRAWSVRPRPGGAPRSA